MRIVKTLPLALVFVIGCATPGQKATPRSALDEDAPAPPSDEKIHAAKVVEQKKQEEAVVAPIGQKATPQQKKLALADRADFDQTVQKWEAAKKQGGLSAKEARALAAKFQSVASSKPQTAAQAHFNAGTLYDHAGDAKEAESEYQAALAANPAYSPALNNLGEIYYRTGSPQRAREWFQKALDADPTHNAPAYNNMALMLYTEAKESGNTALYKDAVAKLRRALAIDSESMAAYSLLALIYYTTAEGDRSKLQLAELVCDEAKKTNDKYAPIYNTLGLIKLRRKNVTGALSEFQKAAELDPRYLEAHLNIGAIQLSSRQYEKAEKSFQAALALKSDNIDAVIGLGVALRGLRKFDEAETSYKKAQQLDGKNCAVAYNLGVLYQDYKSTPDNTNLNQAKEFYRQYVACQRSTPKKVEDANRRVKDIDDTFAAIEQQKKMEAESKVMQEEAERQQKVMEEQQKKMEEEQKKQEEEAKAKAPQAAGAPGAAPGAPADAKPKKSEGKAKSKK